MSFCPQCQSAYNDEDESCPYCGAYQDEAEDMVYDDELVIAFQAGDEPEAWLIKGLLESSGIPVMIRSRQAAMYDSVMTFGESYWGDIMVHRENLKTAQRTIRHYLQNIGADGERKEEAYELD
jgi:hypothetical protein